MPADEPPFSLDELSALLRRHEGPAHPTSRRARRSLVLRPSAIVAVAALLLGSGLGFGAASRLTPSGEAAPPPVGVGFVPHAGWTVLQSGGEVTPDRPAVAIAANVPLHPDDGARGAQSSSGLPYATLLELPPRGIVIVATFSVPQSDPWRRETVPARSLPLRLRDAAPFGENATQLRPVRPLGEYRLRARVEGRDVDLHFYFGRQQPTRAMVVAAQRQLDGLVVQPAARAPVRVEQRALPLEPAAPQTAAAPLATVVDRTLSCTTGIEGGAHNILPSAKSGYRSGARFRWLGEVSVATPGHPLPSHPDHLRKLAAVTAGWPPPTAMRAGGAGYDAQLCKPARATVRLSARGLVGGAAGIFGDTLQCLTPKTVLVRLRVVFRSPTRLRLDSRRRWMGATARVDKGELAVQTLGGKRLVYAGVLDSGRARIFTKACN